VTGKDDLNPSAWRDVNEAVGEAMGAPPPDPVADRPSSDAPAHGASPARLVPGDGPPEAQPKLPHNGVRYRSVTAKDLRDEYARRRMAQLREQIERRNLEAAARAHPAFRKDGSLMGEYHPMTGDASTPDVVDVVWWLGLPKLQAMWELGITSEATYKKVYEALAPVAAQVENRRRQLEGTPGYTYVPLVVRRRRRRHNTDLFQGGRITRIKPMTDPDDVPKPRRPD